MRAADCVPLATSSCLRVLEKHLRVPTETYHDTTGDSGEPQPKKEMPMKLELDVARSPAAPPAMTRAGDAEAGPAQVLASCRKTEPTVGGASVSEAGGSHISVVTMNANLTTVDAHIDAIRRWRESQEQPRVAATAAPAAKAPAIALAEGTDTAMDCAAEGRAAALKVADAALEAGATAEMMKKKNRRPPPASLLADTPDDAPPSAAEWLWALLHDGVELELGSERS